MSSWAFLSVHRDVPNHTSSCFAHVHYVSVRTVPIHSKSLIYAVNAILLILHATNFIERNSLSIVQANCQRTWNACVGLHEKTIQMRFSFYYLLGWKRAEKTQFNNRQTDWVEQTKNAIALQRKMKYSVHCATICRLEIRYFTCAQRYIYWLNSMQTNKIISEFF